MFLTASVTELRDELANVFDQLEKEKAIIFMRHSKPAGVLVSTQTFDKLLTCLENYGNLHDALERLEEVAQGEEVIPAGDILKQLQL